MRGRRWLLGAMVLAALVSACGGGEDDTSDAANTSTVTALEQATETTSTTVDEQRIDLSESAAETEDEPVAVELTADDVEAVVLGGWDMIWDADFASLIDIYTTDCRSRLSVEDFEATLGLGVDAVIEMGIDFDDIVVEVAVTDFVENTSAVSVSTLTFPGEEPSDEEPSVWVVQDAEWRRADCDEVVGAGGSGARGGVGSLEQPATFGSVFDLDDWRATVVGLTDPLAEGLLASFTEPPPPGHVDVMVTYIALYFGDEIGVIDPFVLRGLGSTTYSSFDSGCALASEMLAAEEVSTYASALPGQQLTIATCITVPEDEVEDMSFQLEHAFSNSAAVATYSPTGEMVEDPGPRALPEVDLTQGALGFGETVSLGTDWTFQLVDLVDGFAQGLMSEFNDDPPQGSTFVLVIHEAQYSGPEPLVADPFSIHGLGSAVYASIDSYCSADFEAVAKAFDTSSEFEFEPGETYRVATCLTVPLAEFDNLVIKASNVFDFDSAPERFVR